MSQQTPAPRQPRLHASTRFAVAHELFVEIGEYHIDQTVVQSALNMLGSPFAAQRLLSNDRRDLIDAATDLLAVEATARTSSPMSVRILVIRPAAPRYNQDRIFNAFVDGRIMQDAAFACELMAFETGAPGRGTGRPFRVAQGATTTSGFRLDRLDGGRAVVVEMIENTPAALRQAMQTAPGALPIVTVLLLDDLVLPETVLLLSDLQQATLVRRDGAFWWFGSDVELNDLGRDLLAAVEPAAAAAATETERGRFLFNLRRERLFKTTLIAGPLRNASGNLIDPDGTRIINRTPIEWRRDARGQLVPVNPPPLLRWDGTPWPLADAEPASSSSTND